MDPNAALAAIRALVEKYRADTPTQGDVFTPEDTSDLVDHVEALDGWLANGGFRPSVWQRRPEPDLSTDVVAQQHNQAVSQGRFR